MADAESKIHQPVPHPLTLVVLISGSGSNLQAIIDQIENGKLNAVITAVISNRNDAYGLQRASEADIPTIIINHRDYADRQSFDKALRKKIDIHNPDLLILAGFMRILTADFVNAYSGRLLNIHPSLLPEFQGLNTHERALARAKSANNQNNKAKHGCSVHFVTEDLDGGPIIAQSIVRIDPLDTAESLAIKVQQEEHRLYPACIQLFTENKLKLSHEGVLFKDHLLPLKGLQVENSNYSVLSTP